MSNTIVRSARDLPTGTSFRFWKPGNPGSVGHATIAGEPFDAGGQPMVTITVPAWTVGLGQPPKGEQLWMAAIES